MGAPPQTDALLTPHEAATLLRVTPSTVYRWVRDGSLPAVRLGHAAPGGGRRVLDSRSDEPSSTTTTAPCRRARLTRSAIVAASLKTGMTIRWSATTSPAHRTREHERGTTAAAGEAVREGGPCAGGERGRRHSQRTQPGVLAEIRGERAAGRGWRGRGRSARSSASSQSSSAGSPLPAPQHAVRAPAGTPAAARLPRSAERASGARPARCGRDRHIAPVALANLAKNAGVPILAGSECGGTSANEAKRIAGKLGYPVILKAAKGGGGRGMRVVNGRRAGRRLSSRPSANRRRLRQPATSSSRSSSAGPGTSRCSCSATSTATWCICSSAIARCSGGIRRSSRSPRRRTSIRALRDKLCDAALADRPRRAATRTPAPSSSSSIATRGEFYFIEVNPRIQVEHTVTEEVTGIDIVKSQILIAAGRRRSPIRRSAWPTKSAIRTNGFAIQCRVTTEDPANNFLPDYGRLTHYRSASGMGIRLDAGTAFSGAVVTPFYDSLLVKVTARGRRFVDAARRMERCLQEFRIRGVKTNIPFLINLVTHPTFLAGECTTRFIDETPELFQFAAAARPGHASCCTYLGEVIVNGNPLVKDRPKRTRRAAGAGAAVRSARSRRPPGTRRQAQGAGAEKFAQWVLEQKPLLLTDTTFRDAHQSLLGHADAHATTCCRSPTPTPGSCRGLFSLEMWGGATFDTAMRFLKEVAVAAAGRAARADSEHPVPDAAAGQQRRRLHELSRQRRARRSSAKRPTAGHRRLPHLRLAQLGAEHARGDGRRARSRRPLRGGHLLHRRHPRSERGRSTT